MFESSAVAEAKWIRWRRKIRRGFMRSMAACDLTPPPFRIMRTREPCGPFDIIVRREKKLTTVLVPHDRPAAHPRSRAAGHGATYLAWFLHADVREISGNTSDGHYPSLARYCFSSCGDPVPIPDYYFYKTKGHEAMRQSAKTSALPWNERTDDLVWRGRATGSGPLLLDLPADHPGLNQRLALAMRTRGGKIDFRFVNEPWTGEDPAFDRAGLSAGFIAAETWGTRKFAIDIDGNTNTWDNLFHRLLLGCCVLKVDGPFNFRQWYYDRLRAWEHYIPVNRDLSDIEEKYDWALTNQDRAREIAAAGQAVALEATWERECRRAGQIIEQTEAARGS